MKKIFKEIKNLISKSKNAIVAAHIDPDGDTLGSMIAMTIILEKMNLETAMYAQDGVPNVYKFLPYAEKIISHPPKKEFDIMVAVDASDLKRIGDKKIKAKSIINIDHHPDNDNFGDINCVELLSSVGELVYKIAGEFKIEITKEMATALYVSIITDTGNFRYSNTLPSTFAVAKDLAERGANPFQIANKVYDTKNIEGLKLLAETLNNLQFTKDKKIIWASITRNMIHETQAKSDDLIGIIDHLRAVKEAEVAALFREDKNNMIKVNLRSKGLINVSKIANVLGGGGHIQAAGCQLDMPLAEAEKKVIGLIQKEFQ